MIKKNIIVIDRDDALIKEDIHIIIKAINKNKTGDLSH
jgi:hypothetical protein